MGLLKHFRSRVRLKSQQELSDYPKPPRRNFSADLPTPLLVRIFTFVCPHAADETFETNENSIVGEGCQLCDIRDLANCAKVCRRWAIPAQNLLYHSVRIDNVHFCGFEDELSDRRHKEKIDPADVPTVRLRLLQRTLWESPGLASRVQLLKLPYMTREANKGDLARTISALPNLVYVDLPDGFFGADASSTILRDELAKACVEIRKMRYAAGAESVFESLLYTRHWPRLEVIELDRLDVEPQVVRSVLALYICLREVKFTHAPRLNDALFQPAAGLSDFPPVAKLTIEGTSGITGSGLVQYLSNPHISRHLTFLSLAQTGVSVIELHEILYQAVSLANLSISDTVTASFPLDIPPALASLSLRTLHYEITPDDSLTGTQGTHDPSKGYYSYLISSLQANALPSLRKLYVREPDFPERLLLIPPAPAYVGERGPPSFSQRLEVYTKGPDSLEWMFSTLTPDPTLAITATNVRRASMGRPVSAYDASHGLGPEWGGGARKSVIVGDGTGGFLAVPPSMDAASGLPGSAGSLSPMHAHSRTHSRGSSKDNRRSRADLWR